MSGFIFVYNFTKATIMASNRYVFSLLKIIIPLSFLIFFLIFLKNLFDRVHNIRNTDADSVIIADRELFDSFRESIVNFYHQPALKIRNIPQKTAFLQRNESDKLYHNKSCANYATLYDIKFVNTFWQLLNTPHGNLYLYGAYYDNRNLTLTIKPTLGPAVRIWGIMDWDVAYHPNTDYFCQFWFENEAKPMFSKVIDRKYNWKGYKGPHQPFLYTCKVPFANTVPSSVSVVLHPCDNATNHLGVQYEKPTEKQDFAVCVKGLNFLHEDISIRLVEWIELLRLLGAAKIFMYEFSVHPNVSKVLAYYKSTGYVDVTPLTLPGYLPNDPILRDVFIKNKIEQKRRNELITYNDCFYRNLYNYKLIALLDIDEVIVPLGDLTTWKELLVKIGDMYPNKFHNFSTIGFQNSYFFDTWRKGHPWISGIPKHMHILQHIYRSRKHLPPTRNNKSFFNTERALTLHNHVVIHCLGSCGQIFVNYSLAHLQHYKPYCPEYLGSKCKDFGENPVKDTTVWKYSEELLSRTEIILTLLRLI